MAKARAIVWGRDIERVLGTFQKATCVRLAGGIKARPALMRPQAGSLADSRRRASASFAPPLLEPVDLVGVQTKSLTSMASPTAGLASTTRCRCRWCRTTWASIGTTSGCLTTEQDTRLAAMKRFRLRQSIEGCSCQ